MKETFLNGCRSLMKDQPGKRFQNFFSLIHGLGLWVRISCILLGFVLTILGFLLGLVPGVPGIVLGFLGFGLIASQFHSTALFADRLEISLRKAFSWIRGFFIKPAARHIDVPVFPVPLVTVNGEVMPVNDDGQHTGLESRFEEEVAREIPKEKSK